MKARIWMFAAVTFTLVGAAAVSAQQVGVLFRGALKFMFGIHAGYLFMQVRPGITGRWAT
jgi:hypothetical protein